MARARDSERNADRAFHAKKEEEEQQAEKGVVEIKKSTRKEPGNNKGEEEQEGEEEREIVIDREFLEGRRRVSTAAPFLRGPRPATSWRETEEVEEDQPMVCSSLQSLNIGIVES